MATAELVRSVPLPEAVAARGIDDSQWSTLCHSLFPGARPESVLLVIDYCRARKLDPMKKPCHIVPMRVKDAKTGNYDWRDVVMPGIYEYRTTAMRTGLYMGHSKPTYGPVVEHFKGFEAPDWCEMTMYRRASNGERIEFPVQAFFAEVVAIKDGKPNERWTKARIQMLTKCTEAAGLREAFPDEFGGEQTAEEMDGQATEIEKPQAPQPAQRISQQATPPVSNETPAAPPVAESPAQPAEPAKTIGVIVDVTERGGGAAITLDSGFKCSTKDPASMSSAASLRDSKRRVELVTRPSSDPAKYMPNLTEILVLPEDAK